MDQRDSDERQVVKDNIKNFEERIDDVIGLGAGDRETALRWIAKSRKILPQTRYRTFCLGARYHEYSSKLVF